MIQSGISGREGAETVTDLRKLMSGGGDIPAGGKSLFRKGGHSVIDFSDDVLQKLVYFGLGGSSDAGLGQQGFQGGGLLLPP